MNAHDRNLAALGAPAEVRYGHGEFRVIRPGAFVVCAVSGKRIPIDALRYWNPERQEAYAGPAEALQRWRELGEH